MERYFGLDVSLKETSICVVDDDGGIVSEGTVNSEPEAIAAFVKTNAPHAKRVGLETGPTTTWLWHELRALGLPVICIDARHAKAALSMQINKSDRNDAMGLARIMQVGWYKEIQVKQLACHVVRAVLNSRALLEKIKRDLGNQIRGLLKNLGLIVGKARGNVFRCRVEELIDDHPHLQNAIRPLLSVREQVGGEIAGLDRKLLNLSREHRGSRRLMTVPGVGPITALAFCAAIDEPERFERSRSVGAYFGLTPRRHASGEIDWTGRISKCGDRMVRSYLFEAAGVLLTRVSQNCRLKTWGLRVRPETLCRITEFSEHESNGRELDEGERVAVEVLPVLGQSAAAVEPGDGAFDHPTPGLDDEALHPIGSLDDLGLEIGQDAGQGAVKDRPLIGAVGEQFPEKGKQTEQGRQQRETAVAILNVGGGDDAVQQQALRIDQNMPLLALDQLAGIEAVAVDASPPFSVLFTL